MTAWPASFRGFGSFRARVFWLVVPIVVSFLVFQGWMNVREHRRLITDEFEKRGRALAANLGFASELGVFSEDKQLLESAIRGALRDPDVGYVVIQSREGKVLADGGRQVALAGGGADAVVDRPLSRRVARADQRFIEFVAPIVAEAAQDPEEFLIETRAGPGGQAPRGKIIGAVRLGLSLGGVERQTWDLTTLWGGITLVFLAVGTVIIYAFSRRITNPIKRLTQHAQKIAAGRLEEQIPVQSRDEIGQLASSFNQMTGALKVSLDDRDRALAELQELNRTLEDRIRERTAELEAKSRQLEAASRHKSDFLANVSHELRTPMNAILGFNEMILDSVYGEVPKELKRPLTDMQNSGQQLLRLINDVLDLSKIEAGRMELSLTDYSVRDAVEAVRASLGSLAAEKGLTFVATVPEDLPLAHGDGKRIAQCLMNLAGNALKFTREGRVEIAVDQRGESLVFRVSDTGIGIAPEQIDGLFTEFQQADATIAREFGGTGLGLSITKKFVEMHGGLIWVESEVGRGSTFFFSIPLRLEAGRAA